MRTESENSLFRLTASLMPTGAALAAWAVWLGWDQQRDLHADGSTTGPYAPWQVAGLVLTLLAAVYASASRGRVVAAVLGTTAGLAAASFYDWSDDDSGLFVIGVAMVAGTALSATSLVAPLIARWRDRGNHRPTGAARWYRMPGEPTGS
ncbi:hypothetical protein [uncultured Streptomyces sp.]|uniref:hypothetical protein n=1 Tax=uncultured Streptomyces sp. TaxID=174707 RepID=UPI002638FFE7|nr:hypothetical protein [uncultured Streptomyces sp.]